MSDAGGPGRVRKCRGTALADLGDTENFDRDGKEGRLYAHQLSEGEYKRKEASLGYFGALEFDEVSNVGTSLTSRSKTDSYASLYWELVDCLCGPRANMVAY